MKLPLITTCLVALTAGPLAAATISVTNFTTGGYHAAADANGVTEDFEGFVEANVANGVSTSVGTFATLGGTGTGGTVRNAGFANDGSMLAMRDGRVYGRRSTTRDLTGNSANDMFLDSNDTHGIRWDVSNGGGMFRKLVLTLSDAADTGARMEIEVGGSTYSFDRQRDGNRKLVTIVLDHDVSATTVFFRNLNRRGNLRRNDGFSLDDVNISPVPLPASALLLLGGLGGLGLMRRSRKA